MLTSKIDSHSAIAVHCGSTCCRIMLVLLYLSLCLWSTLTRGEVGRSQTILSLWRVSWSMMKSFQTGSKSLTWIAKYAGENREFCSLVTHICRWSWVRSQSTWYCLYLGPWHIQGVVIMVSLLASDHSPHCCAWSTLLGKLQKLSN